VSAKFLFICAGIVVFTALDAPRAPAQQVQEQQSRLESLGQALFLDINLSKDRNQSCASCHDPAHGFIDVRSNGVAAAASLGSDGFSLSDRNAPTISYAAAIPEFHRDEQGSYQGGLFWDGRATDLEHQAASPVINNLEMAMPDQAMVRLRLLENPYYEREFTTLFESEVLLSSQQAFAAMTKAIAAFERSQLLSPFDSKYDRYLRGTYRPSREEELGMALFFSPHFTSCNQCHQLNKLPASEGETFSNYHYENIGLPVNVLLRSANGKGETYIDHGLGANPHINNVSGIQGEFNQQFDPAQDGRFKVPTLRNVAITGPYMHNGVFQSLRTVLHFYNSYNSSGVNAGINPETGAPWGEPEISVNIALLKLQASLPLESRQIDALLAFLKMLTDQRYEHLLDQ
jgi:cytochrome c peroxidase